MSFHATSIRLAIGPRLTVTPKGRLPRLLGARVKLAEAKERDYEKRVKAAQEAGQPIPKFKQPVIPMNLKPFTVKRSENGNLPVYTQFRANGDCSTEIRKIEGDSVSCMRELNAYLENTHIDPVSNPPRALLRQTSGNLVIKGNLRSQVKDWMSLKGF